MSKCYLLLSILLICLISIFLDKSLYKSKHNIYEEYDNNNINFVSPSEAYLNIINNGYIHKFNETDMKVRNCNNIEDCEDLYKKNIIFFTTSEKNILTKYVNKANTKIKRFPKFYNIPWKFAKVTNKIDNGLPHTHNDTIYLSNLFFKNPNLDTIIHEKIHLYQKLYPEKTDILYKNYNYEKIQKNNNDNRRCNPDLNEFDYKHNGVLIYSIYKDNANTLKDIKLVNSDNNSSINSSINEHPDEYFAYTISNKILNGFNKDDDKLINYLTI